MFTSHRTASTLRGMSDPQLQQMTATLDELDGRERALRAEVDALRGRMVEWTQAEYLKAQRYWDDYRRAQGVAQAVAPAPVVMPPARMPVPARALIRRLPSWNRGGCAKDSRARRWRWRVRW